MSPPDFFIEAARKFLSCGKKKKCFSSSLCLDLASQVLAVDLGLKPSLLYDCNAASPEQVQRYLSSLRDDGLVSTALRIVVVDGNTLIVNTDLMISHMEELLLNRSLTIIDVCPSREQPAMADLQLSGTKDMVQAMLGYFKALGRDVEYKTPLVSVLGEELCGQWNLCTLFGVVLGYPASYWFDQAQGFENCLSMTPLVVTKVSALWRTVVGEHRCCLYSFSIPEVLWSKTQTAIDKWTEYLKERFSQQSAFTELSFSRTTAILPSVAL